MSEKRSTQILITGIGRCVAGVSGALFTVFLIALILFALGVQVGKPLALATVALSFIPGIVFGVLASNLWRDFIAAYFDEQRTDDE